MGTAMVSRLACGLLLHPGIIPGGVARLPESPGGADLMMKLCKDCKHFNPRSERCNRPLKPRFDLVYGETSTNNFRLAENERRSPWFRKPGCGPDGRFFALMASREASPTQPSR